MSNDKIKLSDEFDKICPDFVVDKDKIKNIQQMLHSYVNRNPDHSAFFGGNLLGVQVVKFLNSDVGNWFDQILDCDDGSLQDAIYRCDDINKDFEVSSNAFNMSCMWVCHKIANSGLPKELVRQGLLDTLTYMQIKFITGRLYRLFPYPANKSIAEATYASLTNKYAIKEHGTWMNWLRYRSGEIIASTSRTWKAIQSFEPNYELVIGLNTTQGQIRSMMKFYRRAMETVRVEGGKIVATSSSAVGHDGEEILKDKKNSVQKYLQYLRSITTDKNSFIRQELVMVVCKIIPSAQSKYVISTLEHISVNFYKKDHAEYERVFELLLVHSFDYLSSNKSSIRQPSDLGAMLLRLRGAYTSARSSDPDLIDLRLTVEKLIKPAVDSKTPAVLSSVRTAIMLYLVVRAYTMSHYTA